MSTISRRSRSTKIVPLEHERYGTFVTRPRLATVARVSASGKVLIPKNALDRATSRWISRVIDNYSKLQIRSTSEGAGMNAADLSTAGSLRRAGPRDRRTAPTSGIVSTPLSLLRLLGAIAAVSVVWLVALQIAADWRRTAPETIGRVRSLAEEARDALEADAALWQTALAEVAVKVASDQRLTLGGEQTAQELGALAAAFPIFSELRLFARGVAADGRTPPSVLGRPGSWRLVSAEPRPDGGAGERLAARASTFAAGAPVTLVGIVDDEPVLEQLRALSARSNGRIVARLEDGAWIGAAEAVDLLDASSVQADFLNARPEPGASLRIRGEDYAVAFADIPSLHARVLAAIPETGSFEGWRRRAEVLGGSAVVLILLMWLTVRQAERRDKRQLAMLRGSASASAELVGILDRGALLERLAQLAPAILGGGRARVLAPGVPAGAREQTVELGGRDKARLALALPRDLLKDPAVPPTLAQIAHSASAALDTIELLGSREEALRRARLHRQEAEAAQREMQAVFAAMSDGVINVDGEGCITYANAAAARLFPAVDGLIGRSLREVAPDLRLDEAAAVATGEAELRLCQAGGAGGPVRTLSLRLFPHNLGRALYLRDVTAQVEAEQREQEAAKMDAIGHLTGGIAHDFNNMLTVVLGSLEYVELEAALPPHVRDALEQASRAAESAAELTRQLLAFARRQPLAPRMTDVSVLVRRVAGLLERTLGGSAHVAVAAASDQWPALVDPTQLEAALINLAVNGRDAMPRGGKLAITASNAVLGEEEDAPPGRYVRLTVSDEGCGIPPEHLSRVFEPFFTTKPAGEGTGLGLAMVYGFARQSGGRVRIRSAPLTGTTVEIMLPSPDAVPSADDDAVRAPAPSAAPSAAPCAGRRARIMLVEDMPDVRASVSRRLAALGYEVEALPDGQAAQERLALGAWPDLLVTDVLMPRGCDGFALLEWARRRRPDLPVVLMSGEFGPDAHVNTLENVALVEKPIKATILATQLQRLLKA
jgi:signal transduction histidine kinase